MFSMFYILQSAATGRTLFYIPIAYNLLSGGMRLVYIYTWLIFTLANVSTPDDDVCILDV